MTREEKTVQVWIGEDEYWPFRVVYEELPYAGYGDPVSVPAKTLARWKRTMAKFEQVQREMKEANQ